MKLKIKGNSMREPPGGHQFTEKGVTFDGERFSEVVEKLTDFRINNGTPLGNPEQDVLTYYAKLWPYLVESDESKIPEVKDDSVKSKWRDWVLSTWKNPPKSLTTIKEARIRWDICRACKYNIEVEITKSAEDQEIDRKIFLLDRGQPVPLDLGFCSFHGFDLRVASLIEKPLEFSKAIRPDENDVPCWLSPDKPKYS